jgi:hypothetical protein
MMKNTVKRLAIVVACYLVAWTLAYIGTNGPDFSHYFDYLVLFWNRGGLERPTLTGMVSIVLATPLAAGVFWRWRRVARC